MKCQSLDMTGVDGCRECYEVSWSEKKNHLALVLVWARNIFWNLQDTDWTFEEPADLTFYAMINRGFLCVSTCDGF